MASPVCSLSHCWLLAVGTNCVEARHRVQRVVHRTQRYARDACSQSAIKSYCVEDCLLAGQEGEVPESIESGDVESFTAFKGKDAAARADCPGPSPKWPGQIMDLMARVQRWGDT